MPRLRHALKIWLPLAAAISLLSGLLYAVLQQEIRQSGNNPQIQMAEDAARALAGGQKPDAVVPSVAVDIAQSLAAYLTVFDSSGKAIASSGLLHNQMPVLPPGVFDYVRQNGEDRITWQPETGVRDAAVIVGYGGAQSGFVMAGRSLRELEQRSDNIMEIVALCWAATLAAATLVLAAAELAL